MNEMQEREMRENEAPQIYNRASEDPLLKELKEDITRRTNLDTGVTAAVNNGRASGLDSYGDRWSRANIRETLHGYTRFVHEHPDVAEAYAEKWNTLVASYPEIRDLPVISLTGGNDLFDWAKKNNVDIPDINEIQTIKSLSETIARIKRQNEENQRNVEVENRRVEAVSHENSGEVSEDFEGQEREIADWLVNTKKEGMEIESLTLTLSPEEFRKKREEFAEKYSANYKKYQETVGAERLGEIEGELIKRMRKEGMFDGLEALRQGPAYQEDLTNLGETKEIEQSAESSDGSLEVEEEQETEPPESREKFQSNEFIRNHIVEHYLSYQDAELPEDTKAKMLEWSKNQDNPKKYAEAIEQMAHRENLDQLQKRAGALRDKMLEQSKKLGIPVSPHGKSISWAMWDLGKQYHYFLHPEESGEGYEIDNPLTSEKKQQEIINRHLGWEAYAAFHSSQNLNFRNRITADSRFTKALDLFRKSPKENRTLSSKDLAELGAILTTLSKKD